jgi:hypothetical protein
MQVTVTAICPACGEEFETEVDVDIEPQSDESRD